jgi:hypothetical protein
MAPKSEQLQIRVSTAQKARLRQLAGRAGMDVSTYVLARALPDGRVRVQALLADLRGESPAHFAFAGLSDVLTALSAEELAFTVADADVGKLSAFARNYVAATVEYLCAKRGVAPPSWARDVVPLAEPWFATPMTSLRAHLLRASPVPFKRRNLFIDAGPDARV